MTLDKNEHKKPQPKWYSTELVSISVSVAFSFFLILVATLYPFNFSADSKLTISSLFVHFDGISDLNDVVRNIFLFLPLGLSLSYWLQRQRVKSLITFSIVLSISFSLSFTVEILQLFLPSRSPTIADTVMNTLGGGLGYFCLYFLKTQSRHIFSIRGLTIGFLGYLSFIVALIFMLQNAASLSNWDSNFPLLVGNESNGARPWQGYVSKLGIASRAASVEDVEYLLAGASATTVFDDALLGDYDFSGAGEYQDVSGQLPALSWVGDRPKLLDSNGVFVSSSHWLKTKVSPTSISQNLRESDQFTLNVAVASSDTSQGGPARIVSISKGTHHRNFTLGQQSDRLILRLRTPLTGNNGHLLEMSIPNIFIDAQRHHLIVIYRKPVLQVYVDTLEQTKTLELTPDVTLFRYLLPFEDISPYLSKWMQPEEVITLICIFLFYSAVFIPLGCLLGLIVSIIRGQPLFYKILFFTGFLLPSLLIELTIANCSMQSFRVTRFMFSILMMMIPTLLLKQLLRELVSVRQPS